MGLKWNRLPVLQVLAALVFLGLVLPSRADDLICFVCGKVITSKYRVQKDYVLGTKVNVCKECTELPGECFACGLPVLKDYKTLTDGRFLCSRDSKEAVGSEKESQQICEEVRNEINREYSRFLTLPDTNTLISVVDKFYLETLFKSPGYERSCVSVFGATQTREVAPGKIIHSVYLLSDLRKSRLMAVYAHEAAHTWIGENVKVARRASMDKNTLEAFCELLAYKFLDGRHEDLETQNIKNSPYTKGQIDVMLAADSRYGLNAVLEWMKSGEDDKLEMSDLDRVRAVKSEVRTAAIQPQLLVVQPAVPTPVPDRLVLKGISGTANNRFALINNATLEVMERGKVRVGQTNVTVRCLEIRDHSVVIEVNGTGQKTELFLAGSQ
jgi:DNA-directed RNA polymerase subunit N (RpoN/RPB10)